MSNIIYIHANAGGTYQGNGGFICLNELGYRLTQIGYTVKWFDHADRLRPEMWQWTGYGVPRLEYYRDVMSDLAPVVTTWLYSWLDVVQDNPILASRLRYWCSGELLRDEPRYDASRAFVREHLRTIAINNPALADEYRQLDIEPRYGWTNWVRDLFQPAPENRQWGLIGVQPEDEDAETVARLEAEFGRNNIMVCTGTQEQVARKMQLCDLYLSWNTPWPMTFGRGESFGLNAYEAMACGAVTVTRWHKATRPLEECVTRSGSLDEAVLVLSVLRGDAIYRETRRKAQQELIERDYRWDERRHRAIVTYIEEGARV